ncbi:hypothetical protein C169_25518 [Paenibacillus sp. FSL R5-808]|nr:hypothetical protein C169_25518 [Paenibacillus sp. FSL R5-808]
MDRRDLLDPLDRSGQLGQLGLLDLLDRQQAFRVQQDLQDPLDLLDLSDLPVLLERSDPLVLLEPSALLGQQGLLGCQVEERSFLSHPAYLLRLQPLLEVWSERLVS